MPDCAIVYNFFERQLKEDAELTELFGLFESLPLNQQKPSALFSGYVDRAQELLKKKAGMFADLAVGIRRIEVYLGLAKLMLQSRTAPNGNRYSFVSYASPNEPAVFEAEGLWNTVPLVFDEMFSGTTPHEGISCAFATISSIVTMPHVLSCIATHFKYLIRLPAQHPSIVNKCVRLEPVCGSMKYLRSFILENGVSDQHVALDMLDEQGIQNDIVQRARAVLRDVEQEGISS